MATDAEFDVGSKMSTALQDLATALQNSAASSFQNSAVGFQNPAVGFQNPAVGFQNPAAAFQNPVTAAFKFQNPVDTFQNSAGAFKFQNPLDTFQNSAGAFKFQNPFDTFQNSTGAFKFQNPLDTFQNSTGAFKFQNPLDTFQNSAAAFQNPSTTFQNPSTSFQNPSTYQNPSAAYQNPTAAYQNPTAAFQDPTTEEDPEDYLYPEFPEPEGKYSATGNQPVSTGYDTDFNPYDGFQDPSKLPPPTYDELKHEMQGGHPDFENMDEDVPAYSENYDDLSTDTNEYLGQDRKYDSRKWTQYLAAFLASLTSMSMGYVTGWAVFALPYFAARDPSGAIAASVGNVSLAGTMVMMDVVVMPTPLNGVREEVASRVCSLVALGGMMGAMLSGTLANYFGRKRTLLLMTLPCIASWATFMSSTQNVIGFQASRVFAGILAGITSVVVSIYNEEIAEVSVRGALVTCQHAFHVAGVLAACAVGVMAPYALSTILPCAVPAVLLLFLPFIPESPFFLLCKGRVKEAKNALRFLRGPWIDANAAVRELVDQVRRDAPISQQWDEDMRKTLKFRRRFSRASHFPGLRMAFVIMFCRQIVGMHALAYFMAAVFKSPESAQLSTLLIGVVRLSTVVICSITVDAVGRRPLIIISGIGMAVAHAGLAMYFHLTECIGGASGCIAAKEVAEETWWWVPVLLVSVAVVAYALGMGPLPWLLATELAVPEDKAWSAGMAGVINWLTLFIALPTYSILVQQLGLQVTFLISAICCILATGYAQSRLPETKGKSLGDIQRDIQRNRSRRRTRLYIAPNNQLINEINQMICTILLGAIPDSALKIPPMFPDSYKRFVEEWKNRRRSNTKQECSRNLKKNP